MIKRITQHCAYTHRVITSFLVAHVKTYENTKQLNAQCTVMHIVPTVHVCVTMSTNTTTTTTTTTTAAAAAAAAVKSMSFY